MPKSLLSTDPLETVFNSRVTAPKPASVLPLLLVPTLGLAVMTFGMYMHPSATVGAPVLAMEAGSKENYTAEKPSRSESRAALLSSIHDARRNVLFWEEESRSRTATPRSQAKLQAWKRSYQKRLALFAIKYP